MSASASSPGINSSTPCFRIAMIDFYVDGTNSSPGRQRRTLAPKHQHPMVTPDEIVAGHNRREPRIQYPADAAISERRSSTTTARVAAQHDMLDLQVRNRILDNRAGVDVGGADDVGDVAVNKNVTWLQAEDGGLGDARVGAAEPEDSGGLPGREGWEEGRVLVRLVGGPGRVGGEGVREGVGCVGVSGGL
ncbi:hypothetical protein V494_07092 [Pseudogymnoascus sp. VKM F-4513 (FW-928)]|nr:hypothetical protein V494_07092 [Pseudogymnoascus sp. VKM F-4513 (FW-928)]